MLFERSLLASFMFVLAVSSLYAQTNPNANIRLPSPTHPNVVALMRDSRPREALVELERAIDETKPSIESTILRATLLQLNGQAADSEANWQTVIEQAVFMRTFARRAIVQSLVDRDAPIEAEPILSELLQNNPARHVDLLLRVGDTYLDTNRSESAAAAYSRVLATTTRGPSADAARLGLATALEAMGDSIAALKTLHEAQLLHDAAATFVAARREAQRLANAHGEPLPTFAESDYRKLVRRLRRASHFELALTLLDEWTAAYPNTTALDRIAVERIETLYRKRDNVTAVLNARLFYEDFSGTALEPSVRLTDFRLAVRMGKVDRARRLGLSIWEGGVDGSTASQRRSAGLLLAAYLGAIAENEEALLLYRGLFQSASTEDEQRDILWRASIAALRAGKHDRALVNLQTLVKLRPSGELYFASQYWLSVAHERTGKLEEAAKGFITLAERYPYHYYGITAENRLQEIRSDIKLPVSSGDIIDFPSLRVDPTSKRRAEYRAALTLARAGLVGDAAWYLQRLLDQRSNDLGLALLASRASAMAGDYTTVTRLIVNYFGTFLNRRAHGLPNDFWTLVYPRPYWETIVNAADVHHADPLLLLSLMRRESRFDPQARSIAGAIGLLQLMPYTAETLAKRAGFANIVKPDGVDSEMLTDPNVNIAIAARLNADLLEIFEGQRLPVIASYNAGEDHVIEWWRAARAHRQDFFIDSIPYSETRRFAREVVANYASYKRIYGTPRPD